jgi:hypothetical protein
MRLFSFLRSNGVAGAEPATHQNDKALIIQGLFADVHHGLTATPQI